MSGWLLTQRAQCGRGGCGDVEYELILVVLYLGQIQSLAQRKELGGSHLDVILLFSRVVRKTNHPSTAFSIVLEIYW